MESFLPSQFELDRDLFLDIGKAWLEGGLTRPGLPRLVVGYEYHFKDGEKSTLQWLPVIGTSPGGVPEVRSIFPAAKAVDEERHLIRADLAYAVGGINLSDCFEYEYHDLDTAHAILVSLAARLP